MRCKSCDTLLTDRESVRKDSEGRFLDLCGECYSVSAEAVAIALEDHRDTLKDTFVKKST